VNPEVQDLYLKGSYLVKGSPQQQRTARDYFEQAIRIDPNYAPAYAGLAEYYWFTPELTPELRRSEATPKAEQYALKALELDPNLAAAHTSLGILRFYADWDWGAAEKEFQRAIQLNDNDAEAHRMYAVFLSALGHSQQAQTEIRRAQELDPLYLWTQITAGFIAYFGRRYDDAIAQCRRALDLDPNSAGGYDCLGTAYLAKGMYLQAIEACQRAVQLSGSEPSRLVGLGRAYALAGRKAEAENIFDDLHRQYTRSHISPYYLATLQVALGQPQAALTWLQKAYAERDTYLTWMKVDGALDPLHSEPGFQTLLRTMGFPADKDARQQATAVRQAVLSHGQ
jgi:serine/threonine-protein kinase